jgi:hypothetical protein
MKTTLKVLSAFSQKSILGANCGNQIIIASSSKEVEKGSARTFNVPRRSTFVFSKVQNIFLVKYRQFILKSSKRRSKCLLRYIESSRVENDVAIRSAIRDRSEDLTNELSK